MTADRAAIAADSPAAERGRYDAMLAEAARIKGLSLGRDAWRRLRRNRVAFGSLIVLAVIGFAAALTPLWPLQPPRLVRTELRSAPPVAWPVFEESLDLRDEQGGLDPVKVDQGFGSLGPISGGLLRCRAALFGDWTVASLCGRDELGRDVLSRLFWGARISLVVGLVATLVSLVIGVSYGAVSGYVGGVVDDVLMRIVDVLYSVPFIFVVIFIISVLSAEPWKSTLIEYGFNRITIFFFVVGAIYWLTMARVVRGQVISLKHEQFVEAARTIGAGSGRIVFRHLVPNLLSVIIVYLTLTIPRVMLFEAFLSFLGLGVELPDVSWGLLANQGVRVITPIKVYWWLVAFPGLALGVTLIALNFLGDGLRDALDPRLKHR